MYADRMDFISAYYAFCAEWHDGQWSDLYSKLCRIGRYYTPSPLDKGFKSLSDNGKEIYRALKRKYIKRKRKS
jgi:hypothetical protein